MDGKVYHWEIKDKDDITGRFEHPDANYRDQYSFCHESAKPYSSFVYDEDKDLFIACLPEKNLVVYQNKGKDLMFEYFNQEFSYTSLCLIPNSNVLLCGTSRGSICLHAWPPVLQEKEIKRYKQSIVFRDIEYDEFQPLLFPISHLVLTPGDQYLLIASTDGAMSVLKIEQKKKDEEAETKIQIDNKGGIANTANELFFVKYSQIRQQARAIRDREMEVARYEKKKATDAENKDNEHRAKLNKIDKLFDQSKNSSEEHKNRFLTHSKDQISILMKRRMELANYLEKKSDELTTETRDAVEYEIMRNQELRSKFESLKEERKRQLKDIASEQMTTQAKYASNFQSNICELEDNYKRVTEDAGRYGTVE